VAGGRRETPNGKIHLGHILKFVTGLEIEPVLGYALPPKISFVEAEVQPGSTSQHHQHVLIAFIYQYVVFLKYCQERIYYMTTLITHSTISILVSSECRMTICRAEVSEEHLILLNASWILKMFICQGF
jgi:hypothetical protein